MRDKINLSEKLHHITRYWQPAILAALNGQHVRLAKIKGAFVWHSHQNEDELFLVLAGHLTIQLRDRDVALDAGELFVVPRGVEHKPVAEEEVHLLLFEPASTVNTGNVRDERTVEKLEWI